MFKNIITWLFCFLIILGLQKIKEYIVNKNNKLTIYDYSIRKIKKMCKHKNLKEIETNFIIDFVKNPIMIKNDNNYEIISEKILQKLILENIPSFLKELGSGFTFIDNEYKIKLGDKYNYIDLLLFNIEYNCFVVVELKITELKKEHI